MVVVFSATKGLAAMTLAIAHSRGLIDFDERVATYWPEFAQNGKEAMTVRQLLAHQGGLHAFHEKVEEALNGAWEQFREASRPKLAVVKKESKLLDARGQQLS